MGRRGGGLVGNEWSAPHRRLARPQRRVALLPDAGRRLAAHSRARPGLHAEGGQGSQGPHLLGQPGRGVRRRAGPFRGRGHGRRPVHGRDGPVRRAVGRARPDQLAGPETGAADRPRRARHLSGHRALGPVAGRPRQPPAGRLPGPPPLADRTRRPAARADHGQDRRRFAEAVRRPPRVVAAARVG